MDLILLPLKLFVWHPIAVFIAAFAFAVPCFTRVYSRRSKMILGTVALVWLAYAGWETYMTAWRSPTGDMAIRIDMVLFGPVLLFVAIIGVTTAIRGYKRIA